MSRTVLQTPKPKDYEIPDWDFRLARLETCLNCDAVFEIQHEEDRADPINRLANTLHCGECSCSSYQMSGDKREDKNRCPRGLWVQWSDWKKQKGME